MYLLALFLVVFRLLLSDFVVGTVAYKRASMQEFQFATCKSKLAVFTRCYSIERNVS